MVSDVCANAVCGREPRPFTDDKHNELRAQCDPDVIANGDPRMRDNYQRARSKLRRAKQRKQRVNRGYRVQLDRGRRQAVSYNDRDVAALRRLQLAKAILPQSPAVVWATQILGPIVDLRFDIKNRKAMQSKSASHSFNVKL